MNELGLKCHALHIKIIKEIEKYQFDEVCFVGDDIVDIELMKKVGLSITVPNANYNKVIMSSDWVTPRLGGFGAVRDTCDLIILAKDHGQQSK